MTCVVVHTCRPISFPFGQRRCMQCGEPQVLGKARPPTDAQRWLADAIEEIEKLYEPGEAREEIIAQAVEEASTR